jgi:hypothetical protein
MEMIPIVGVLASSAMVVLVVYFVSRARTRRLEVQVEMQSRLIDRFGSATDLVQFLQSPAGRDFVTGVQVAPAILTRERLLTGFTRAIILIMLGGAFLFLTFYIDDSLAVPAVLLFALGVGYLLATYVSYRFSSSMTVGDVASSREV